MAGAAPGDVPVVLLPARGVGCVNGSPLMEGRRCLYTDAGGATMPVKLVSWNRQEEPPRCTISMIKNRVKMQADVPAHRLRPLPPPIVTAVPSAKTTTARADIGALQRSIRLSMHEHFSKPSGGDTAFCRIVAAAVHQRAYARSRKSAGGCEQAELIDWAATQVQCKALQSKMKTILRSDRDKRNADQEGTGGMDFEDFDSTSACAQTERQSNSAIGRGVEEAEVAQRLEFNPGGSVATVRSCPLKRPYVNSDACERSGEAKVGEEAKKARMQPEITDPTPISSKEGAFLANDNANLSIAISSGSDAFTVAMPATSSITVVASPGPAASSQMHRTRPHNHDFVEDEENHEEHNQGEGFGDAEQTQNGGFQGREGEMEYGRNTTVSLEDSSNRRGSVGTGSMGDTFMSDNFDRSHIASVETHQMVSEGRNKVSREANAVNDGIQGIHALRPASSAKKAHHEKISDSDIHPMAQQSESSESEDDENASIIVLSPSKDDRVFDLTVENGVDAACSDEKRTFEDEAQDKNKVMIEKANEVVAKMRKSDKWPKQAHLKSTIMNSNQFRFIFNALAKTNPAMKELDLSMQHALDDEQFQYLVSTIFRPKSCALTWVDVNQCCLTNKAVSDLFRGLNYAKTITYVDLRENKLDEEGIKEIKRGLKKVNHAIQVDVFRKKHPLFDAYGQSLFSKGHAKFVDSDQELEESSDESEQDLSDGEAEVYRRMTGRGQSSPDASDDEDLEDPESMRLHSPRPRQGRGSSRGVKSREEKRETKQGRIDECFPGDISGDDESDEDFRKKDRVRGSYSSSRRRAIGSVVRTAGGAGLAAGGGSKKTVIAIELLSKDIESRRAGKKLKLAGGHSHRRGSGTSRYSCKNSSFQQGNLVPTQYGFGTLQPPKQQPHARGTDGASRALESGRARDDSVHMQEDDRAHSSHQSQRQGEASLSEKHKFWQPFASSEYQRNNKNGLRRPVPEVKVGPSRYDFPRSLPLQLLERLFDRRNFGRTYSDSQWPVPVPLAQRNLESIQRDDPSETIEQGLRRCDALLSDGMRPNIDGWDEAASVNFFQFILNELLKCSENGSDLSRSRLYISVLRRSNQMLLSSYGGIIQALDAGDGARAWLRLYTQMNFYLLRWLQVMEGPAWHRAIDAAEGSDKELLRRTYTFSAHSDRLLRIMLFVADSPRHGKLLMDCLHMRLAIGREHRASVTSPNYECILELWAQVIRLLDAAEKEEDRFWRRLVLAFQSFRCKGPDKFYYTLPHLNTRPDIVNEMPEFEYSILASAGASSGPATCSKEEAMEFWWIAAALTTTLYDMYNMPLVGGWDLLSLLLANSPLMPGGESAEFHNGSLFKVQSIDVIRLDNKKREYLLEIIDRCSVMVTMWPLVDNNGKHSFSNLNLISDLSKLAVGSLSRPCKGLIAELWRLVTTDRGAEEPVLLCHASDEELSRVGRLPHNYPFCTKQELDGWIANHGGGRRSLCGALLMLVQNVVLRTQRLDHTTCSSCREEFAKDFGKLDSSLQVFLRKEPVMRLDPASLENFNGAQLCRLPQELRRFRSTLLLLSLLLQLAPTEHRSVTGQEQMFRRIADTVSIPDKINSSWHLHLEYITNDMQVRLSFIQACCQAVNYLVESRKPFTCVAEMLQRMLKLVVLEITYDNYPSGNYVGSLKELKDAAAAQTPGASFQGAQQAEQMRKFWQRRVDNAEVLTEKLLARMGGVFQKWLGECQVSIERNIYGDQEGRSKADQIYEFVNTDHGHLKLLGPELILLLGMKDYSDRMCLAIWKFVQDNVDALNDVNNKTFSSIMQKFGKGGAAGNDHLPIPSQSPSSSNHTVEQDEEEESYDWNLAENGTTTADEGPREGATVSEQDARALAMRLTTDIFSFEPISKLLNSVFAHIVRRLKHQRTHATTAIKDQIILTFSSLAVAYLRSSSMQWKDLESMIFRTNMTFEERQTSVAIFCKLLRTLNTGLDASWNVAKVKQDMVRIWFIGMFERRLCRTPFETAGRLILDLSSLSSGIPFMQGVHEAMVSAMDSSLNRPRYPHMYERPVAPSCLVLFKDEIKIHGGSSSFQQRIQGIRQFAFMIEQMTSDADQAAILQTILHGWRDMIKKEWLEIEDDNRAGYCLYCLETFAILFPCCAEFLHMIPTLDKKGSSSMLIDLCNLLFFETFLHPAVEGNRRLLESRTRCVPAIVLGVIQLDCDKRLVEIFGSLVSLVMNGVEGSGDMSSSNGGQTMHQILEILFLQSISEERLSGCLLQQQLSRAKMKSTSLLTKFVVHSLFQSLVPSGPDQPGSLSRSCAAAEILKSVVQFVSKRGENVAERSHKDALYMAMQSIGEVVHLSAMHLSSYSPSTVDLSRDLWLIHVVDEAVKAWETYLPEQRFDFDGAVAIYCEGTNPQSHGLLDSSLLEASLRVVACRAALAICQASLHADETSGDSRTCHQQEVELIESLRRSRANFEAASSKSQDELHPSEAGCKRLLKLLLDTIDHIVDGSQPSAVEKAQRLNDQSTLLAELNVAARRVQDRMFPLGVAKGLLLQDSHTTARSCHHVNAPLPSSSPQKGDNGVPRRPDLAPNAGVAAEIKREDNVPSLRVCGPSELPASSSADAAEISARNAANTTAVQEQPKLDEVDHISESENDD